MNDKQLTQIDQLDLAPESQKLSKKVHLMAGWPLILVFFGGLIGGGIGALAYSINLAIYKSDLSKMNKILANIMCGMCAISLWWFSASFIQTHLFKV